MNTAEKMTEKYDYPIETDTTLWGFSIISELQESDYPDFVVKRLKALQYGPMGDGYNKLIVLIDECDQLKEASLKMLRGKIESTQSYTRWCFTCNDDKSIPDAIKSRVHYMPFKKVSAKMFYTKMFDILEKEKIDYTPKILKAYSDHYYCDIRQCISQLQTNAIDGKLSQL